MVLASIDQIPDDLIDNAIVLGCLSFFVAFIFLIDLSEKMGKRRSDATQTDTSSIDRHYAKSHSMSTVNSQANLMDSEEGNRINRNQDSMRSHGNVAQAQTSSNNPFVNTQQTSTTTAAPTEQRPQNYANDQSFTDHSHQEQSYHVHYPSSTFTEDVVETQTLPSPQMPVFSKVKQPPTVLNHFETEPYKKILSRSNQQQQPQNENSHTRYHDQAPHHHDPSFYDDFNNYRKQTYYQGPKVDQGKLVIRDYSQQQPKAACNCQNHQCEMNEGHGGDSATIKSGYVSQVAKLWDSRMKNNQGSVRSHHQKDIKGLNTVV